MSDSTNKFEGMFQDAEGTIPVTKSGDPVGLVAGPAAGKAPWINASIAMHRQKRLGMSDCRSEFESFIAFPPHEKDISRFSEDGSSAWPGSYKNLIVDLAWDAWQASRQTLPSCSEIPNISATGNAVAMGDLTDEEGDLHKKSILIQFANVEDFGAAVKSGQCRFTVFGGGV